MLLVPIRWTKAFYSSQRISTVTAIEFCEIYILEYSNFKKYVESNDTIMQKLNETANIRMKISLKAEEDHKRQLHEKIARESFVDWWNKVWLVDSYLIFWEKLC